MPDFDYTETIELRYFTDLWGVYTFEFEPGIPAGDPISAVTVEAFIGSVKSSSSLSTFATVTSLVVDPAYTPQIANNTQVLVKLQYPGSDYKDSKVTLVFKLTLTSGAKYPFFFPYVKVKGEA
jgi:hypothetical protein